MESAETKALLAALQQIDGKHALVFMRTLRILLACSRDNDDFGAVIVLRVPADDDTWALHVQSLNMDIDDVYLALLNSSKKLGEHINQEAPPRDQLN